jgi:5'-3' exonuclease
MGIPYYFLSLIKKHPRIVSRVVRQAQTDILAIDFNCLIHNYMDDANPIESILAALQMILSTVIHSETVYIAMDGLVPYAKIVQQRYRRFRKPETPTAIFDRHQISPGTPYMKELEAAVSARFPAAIISSTLEPGEGEHKIFQWLVSSPVGLAAKTVTIYGLDADLILLSLKDTRISLLRENVNFKTTKDAGFSRLSISELVKVLPFPAISYFALCILCFGNDFMPSIGMFSLREGGHERAVRIYTECGMPDLLTADGRRTFLESASKHEMAVYSAVSKDKHYESVVISPDGKHFEARYNAHLQDGAEPAAVVREFWYCFYWTYNYFIHNQICDWNFVYRFPEAPLVSQLLRYPETSRSVVVLEAAEPKFTLTRQLQFILPMASLRTAKKRVCYPDEIYDAPGRIPWMRKFDWEVDPRISLPFIEETSIARSVPIV